MRCYASYIDTGFDAIPRAPQQWRVEKFRHVTQLVKRLNRDDADRPMLSLSAYRGVEIKQYDDENLARTKEEALDYQVVEPGQLVVNPMWVIYGAIGVSQLHGIVSPAYRVYRVSSDLTPRYCDYLLRSHFYVSEYNKYVRGLTTYDRSVRKEDFHEIPVLLPTLEEQNAIVAFLDRKLAEIDRFIAAKQRLIALLQEQKSAIINRAVTHGLDPDAPMKPSGIEWLGDVPAHWETFPFRRAIDSICDGPFGSSMKSSHYTESGVRLIRLQNIGNGEFLNHDQAYISEEHFRSLPGHDARPGDLLVAGLGDDNHPAGRACILPSEVPTAMVKADCFRIRLNQDVALHEFVSLYLTSDVAQRNVSQRLRGATRSRINLTGVGGLTLIRPPLQEQRRIVAYVQKEIAGILSIAAQAEREIELIKEYRATLISDAVTGKIDVRAEVAEGVRV